MKKVSVTFIPSWNDETVLDYNVRLARQTPKSTGRWKDIQIVYPPLHDTYAICQDGAASIVLAHKLGFEKHRIIYMKRESDFALPKISNICEHVASAYQGSGFFCPSVWWLSLTWDELQEMSVPLKSRQVSAIVSSLTNLPLHKKRIAFIEELCRDLPVDVFGKNHAPGSFYGKYMGELSNNKFARCKAAGLLPYKYSIAIENHREHGYFTEKIVDCILAYSFPLYHGALDIDLYFPEGSYLHLCTLDGRTVELVDALVNGAAQDLLSIDSLKNARELILHKYNIINVTWSILREIV